jgi:hypothetical protein
MDRLDLKLEIESTERSRWAWRLMRTKPWKIISAGEAPTPQEAFAAALEAWQQPRKA